MIRMFDRTRRLRLLLIVLVMASATIVIIDRGSRQGVRKNMPVVAGDGLVGRVVKVGLSDSVVLLELDRSSAVASRIASTGETGLLEGDGSDSPDLQLFNPDAKVAVGD